MVGGVIFHKIYHKFIDRAKKNDATRKLDIETVSEKYANNILKMNRFAKGFNSNFLVVVQPAKSCIIDQNQYQMSANNYSDFRILIRKYFHNNNIDFIDLNERKKALRTDMFMDELHLDDRGNMIIAEIVAAYIKKNNLLR
jgi:lysophospholipase L1-like esterase